MKTINTIRLGLVLFLAFCYCPWLLGQTQDQLRLAKLQVMLDSAALAIPGLNDSTTLSLRDASVAEYIRSIGVEHNINVYIPDSPGQNITNNLVNEQVKSVFLFICKRYNYTIELTGTILEFVPYVAPPPKEEIPKEQPLNIAFEAGKLSVDLKNDSLFQVIRRISVLTGKKIVTRPGTNGMITAFLPPTKLDTALEAIFLANGFKLTPRKKGYFVLQKSLPQLAGPDGKSKPADRLSFDVESFTDGEEEFITTHAEDADLSELIKAIFEQVESNYLIYDKLQGMITISAEITELEDVLKHVLQGTEYTYKRDDGLYLIGSKELDGLKTTRTVKMKYRPTYQAIDLIPGTSSQTVSGNTNANTRNRPTNTANNVPSNTGNYNNTPYRNNSFQNNYDPYSTGISPYGNTARNGGYYSGSGYGGYGNYGGGATLSVSDPPEILKTLVGDVEIVEYPELNRIILRGPSDKVDEIEAFLEEVDRPVPMVKIEMIVVEVNKDRLLSTGISAGLKTAADSSQSVKNVLPGVDYSLNGSELNAILGTLPGLSNLGVLSSNFYLNLKAQETRGNLKVQMNPVLSMLNGREASLIIGQTQYYLLETQTASTGAVNNFQTFTQRFERIDANISLTIKPYISEDEMVTLDVMPDFTTPVGQFDSSVPPTIATRRFVSTIRVKNGETVILGGLSEEATNENTRGLPVLSRIPVLKWIFGNVNKNKSKSSLIIYITPVIYYN